jgi:hypothetical protein
MPDQNTVRNAAARPSRIDHILHGMHVENRLAGIERSKLPRTEDVIAAGSALVRIQRHGGLGEIHGLRWNLQIVVVVSGLASPSRPACLTSPTTPMMVDHSFVVEIGENALADGIVIGPVAARRGFVDDHHFGRVLIVAAVKQPAAEQWNAQRRKIFAAGRAEPARG